MLPMAANIDHWQNTSKSRRKACEECRRLKLRCEKVFPCESCQKRGCASICPSGSFLKGTRSLKTSSLKLHEKIAHMSTRIQELEDALASLQASVSAEKHPLLQNPEDDGRSRSPILVSSVAEASIPIIETPDELSKALGTLTIRPFGESQFHGETAISEFLLHVNSDTQIVATATQWDKNAGGRMQLDANLVLLSVLFPFPPAISGGSVSTDNFLPYIPTYREALRLSDVYYTNFAWCSMPITREELHETIFAEVYGGNTINLQNLTLHRLSLLFMVFALGSLCDADKPIFPAEAEEYHSLARAALCGEQIFNNTTLDCVQSMSLMMWYMRLCRRRSKGYLWAFSGLLSKLVQAIGLHRETKHATPAEISRRQVTFWEYISGDIWQAFVYGRPSSMVFSQIDCKKPKDVGGMADKTAVLFYKWKYSFTHLVGDVLSQTTGATATSYRNILDLEHKLREFPIPTSLRVQEPGSPGSLQDVPLTLFWQRYVIRLWQHSTLVAIHRRFLVQAIRTHADDLKQSPFIKSVYAAYESACLGISDLRTLYESHPRVLCRMLPYWSHSFTAAIVLGALVTLSPSCILAESAMEYLDHACEIFADAAACSVQPPQSLELMTNIQRKARDALSEYRARYPDALPTGGEYVPLGSSSTSDKRKASPTASQPLDSPLHFMQAATAAAPPPRSSIAQAQANYAAQWLQQAYFPSDVTGVGTAGVGIDFTQHVPAYGGVGSGIAEDDEYAASWLHQQAYFLERSVHEGRDVAPLQFGMSSVLG